MSPVADANYFEARYRREGDPWNFTGSQYEQGRFETIIAALDHRRYRHTFEPGCSIGTLTVRLAALSDRVTASDFSETAVAQARDRCAAMPHVHFACGALSETTPVAAYDLIVVSEIGYYFEPSRWPDVLHQLANAMAPGTEVLASHWLGRSEEHCQSADQVHATLRAEPLLHLEYEALHPGFRLDRFVRVEG